MTEDNNQILISWLSEYVYCPRRFYLKVIEQQKGMNIYLAEGSEVHKSVHSQKIERRGDNIRVTGLHVYSEKLNLYGICDSVEFTIVNDGVYIPFLKCSCELLPVEYKHGRVRDEIEYNVQLTAQALCLEEMFGTKIEEGCVYYTSEKQRVEVQLSDELRKKVVSSASEIAAFLEHPILVEPSYMKRCLRCSVYDLCSPRKLMVEKYMKSLWGKYDKC